MDAPVPPAQLIREVAERGDREAFTTLFRRYAPQVRRYLAARGAAPSVAEELTQEVMLTVWRRAGSFDPRLASAGTWIFTIARNRWVDVLRQRRPPHDSKDLERLPSDAPDADMTRFWAEQGQRVREAMRELPVEQAEVLRAAYFEDKSLGTMATERSIPLGTVKSRYRLAMGRLRQALGMEVER